MQEETISITNLTKLACTSGWSYLRIKFLLLYVNLDCSIINTLKNPKLLKNMFSSYHHPMPLVHTKHMLPFHVCAQEAYCHDVYTRSAMISKLTIHSLTDKVITKKLRIGSTCTEWYPVCTSATTCSSSGRSSTNTGPFSGAFTISSAVPIIINFWPYRAHFKFSSNLRQHNTAFEHLMTWYNKIWAQKISQASHIFHSQSRPICIILYYAQQTCHPVITMYECPMDTNESISTQQNSIPSIFHPSP